ncbi:hypothetical protein L3Q82_008372 [Scortum barcoo]|uniref:Uncharacterized protein n=1 Tax=Scortum barcoo TaxID=214431 RepID=A0ACB8WHT4_9TELE|nr:hypothetical protein L3Q82_008372 [Scortum barcoo]
MRFSSQLYTLPAGCLRVYGSLPNQSTCALWIWRRHSNHVPRDDILCVGSTPCEYGVLGAFAVRSLYIAGSKSDLFPVHVGLRQGCPLSPVLFIIFMDRISRHVARGRRESGLGTTGFHLCFLQMMLSCWLHQARTFSMYWSRFAAECEAAGMRISYLQIRGHGSLWVGGEVLLYWTIVVVKKELSQKAKLLI